MELCKEPELAAEVALGPVHDFDFDVAILFSDLLFPLEALGMGLQYSDGAGPQLGWYVENAESLKRFKPWREALAALEFQKRALVYTRERLARDKSLIGFVGGPWTLFTYAVQGRHDGTLVESKRLLNLFEPFCESLIPLLESNIALQLEGGAEIVMIFDTAAGELDPSTYKQRIVPALARLAKKFPAKTAYYSKGTQFAHLDAALFTNASFAGLGVDHRWDLSGFLKSRRQGFVQGNFDQAFLHKNPEDFAQTLQKYLAPLQDLSSADRAGWVCGLGHGVLPKTPEDNVKRFVHKVREAFSQSK
jgi:uroporphyrinogen decarboxylase